MKIVVIGGTGLIGSKVVRQLRLDGHDAVAASPGTGVNTLTGEGLAEVLQGATVVVDVSNSPSFEDEAVLHFFETSTRTLFCGDLFTHGGANAAPLIESDLLVPAEEFRVGFQTASGLPDAYGFSRDARIHIEKLAATNPLTLAVMHGSSWRGRDGEGAALVRRLGDIVAP